MSGIEDPGAPDDIPAEYADTYRDAYLRALAEEEAAAPPVQLDVPERTPEERSSLLWLIVLVIALVLVAGAYVVGRLVSGDEEPTGADKPAKVSATTPGTPAPSKPANPATPDQPSGTPSSDADPTVPAGPAWTGAVAPVAVTSTRASCTAPDSVDGADNPVTFDVENVVDGDDTTAWRCNDRKVRQRLTFEVPAGTEVGEVGLIPGYAKVDTASNKDRYLENNRITRVRWILADGVEVEQVLDPDDRELQSVRVARTATQTVVLEILAVERGPRNATAVSTVAISAAV